MRATSGLAAALLMVAASSLADDVSELALEHVAQASEVIALLEISNLEPEVFPHAGESHRCGWRVEGTIQDEIVGPPHGAKVSFFVGEDAPLMRVGSRALVLLMRNEGPALPGLIGRLGGPDATREDLKLRCLLERGPLFARSGATGWIVMVDEEVSAKEREVWLSVTQPSILRDQLFRSPLLDADPRGSWRHVKRMLANMRSSGQRSDP